MRFIYDHLHSVEQLEVLLFLRNRRESAWSVQDVSDEMRSTPVSIAGRLASLRSLGFLIKREGTPPTYQYEPKTAELDQIAQELADAYHVHRYKVIDLIFAPTKRARPFAEAFRLKKDGEDDE